MRHETPRPRTRRRPGFLPGSPAGASRSVVLDPDDRRYPKARFNRRSLLASNRLPLLRALQPTAIRSTSAPAARRKRAPPHAQSKARHVVIHPSRRVCVLSAFAVMMLVGCVGNARDTSRLTAWSVTPFPQPTYSVKTYPAREALATGGPNLTVAQRAWIQKVVRSKSYRTLRLRVAILSGFKTPVVVYVDRPQPGGTRGGHVIGEACQVQFDLVTGRVYPGSEASCSPPTPPPVD